MGVWTHFIPRRVPCVWRRTYYQNQYECLNADLSLVTRHVGIPGGWLNTNAGFFGTGDPNFVYENGRYEDAAGRLWILGYDGYANRRTGHWDAGAQAMQPGFTLAYTNADLDPYMLVDDGGGGLYVVSNWEGGQPGILQHWDPLSTAATMIYDLSDEGSNAHYRRTTAVPDYLGDAYAVQPLISGSIVDTYGFPHRYWGDQGPNALFPHNGKWWGLAWGVWFWARDGSPNHHAECLALWKGPATLGGDAADPLLYTCNQKISPDFLNATQGLGDLHPVGGHRTITTHTFNDDVYIPTGFFPVPELNDTTNIYVMLSGSDTATSSRPTEPDESGQGGFVEFDGNLYTIALYDSSGTFPTRSNTVRLYRLDAPSWTRIDEFVFTGHLIDITTTQFLPLPTGFALYTTAEPATRFVWKKTLGLWNTYVYTDSQGTGSTQATVRIF